jgi:hypothetical protein
MQAEFPITVQAIRSKGQKARFYVYVPLPLAAAIGLEAGEQVQWTLFDRNTLQMKRYRPCPIKTAPASKKRQAKRTQK